MIGLAPEGADTVGYIDMQVPGLTYRRLDYWTRAGVLRLAHDPPGSGRRRRWAAGEDRVAALLVRLTAAGLDLWAADRVARGGRLGAGLVLLIDGMTIAEHTEAGPR